MASITSTKEIIASRVAMELQDGDVVNLGIGLPTQVANFIPKDVDIVLQSENGIMGMGLLAEDGSENTDTTNAGGQFVTLNPGGMYFDSATSFSIIRGGHVDVTVLGALQVDASGNLANWIVPGKKISGMGGAMDLVVGAKKVIIAMQHTQNGAHKILKECNLPYTAVGVVNMIVTEMGVMEITSDGIVLKEINPMYDVSQVQEATDADLIISPNLKIMATPLFNK